MGRTSRARGGWIGAALSAGIVLASSSARAEDPAPAPPPRPRIDQPELVRPVPPPPPAPVSRTYMNCEGCAIAGGIVLGAGALHGVVGAVDLYDSSAQRERDGRVLLVLAGIHALVGIPLLVAGVWPVERTGARAAQTVGPPPPSVTVAVGPLGGAVRGSF